MTDTLEPAAQEGAALFLEFTKLEVAADAGTRTIKALAIPYDEELERLDYITGARRWNFEQGSAKFRDSTKLAYGHDLTAGGMPIGKVASVEQTEAGPRIEAKVSETAKGNEVYTLMRDGVLDRVSVGFYPVRTELDETDPANPLLRFHEIDVFEVSVVPDPAFDSAVIESVLSRTSTTRTEPVTPSKGNPMTEQNEAPSAEAFATLSQSLETVTGSLETLERRIATLGAGSGENAGPAVPFRSYGEFLKAAAVGDKAAVEFLAHVAGDASTDPIAAAFLAYTGGTTGDLGDVLKDSWVGDRFRQVEAQRTLLNFFSRSPLPAQGMGVEYGKLLADTTQVEKQANEGDTLAYGKLTFETDRAPLETFGGWGDMSRQEVERAPINVVERFFSALVNKYAQTTEAKVNAAATAGGVALAGSVLDLATADGWIKFVIRAAHQLKDLGYPLEGILVGWDVFEDIATLRDGAATDAPRLLDRNSGNINIPGLKGEMFTLPVIPISTGATTNVVRAVNSEAIRTYEAAGAPFRLQDDDITNLTKAFSVYGYMATATEVPGAIIKPAV